MVEREGFNLKLDLFPSIPFFRVSESPCIANQISFVFQGLRGAQRERERQRERDRPTDAVTALGAGLGPGGVVVPLITRKEKRKKVREKAREGGRIAVLGYTCGRRDLHPFRPLERAGERERERERGRESQNL